MESEREEFNLSGPLHLTFVDWSDPHHRRSVAASLVQGVYILERDRQLKRQPPISLAPTWWEFFHFKLLRQLVDDVDRCIFGAIFEYRPPPPSSHGHHSLDASPRYVIAFRGTLTKPDSFARDIELDLHIIRNGLHETSRFEIALRAVRNMVSAVGDSNVWLTGHSLGAAMAMLAGKTMAKTGTFVQAFLFNSPFFSAPIERIRDKRVQHGIRIANSVITAGLAFASKKTNNIKGRANGSSTASVEDPFVALSSWVPCIYANAGDPICSEYIGYFEHRKKMDEIGIGGIEKLATQNTLGGLLMSVVGRDSEPLHLIPSAILAVNLSPCQDFTEAHGIHQWWRPDLLLQSKLYKYC
ncbi:GDSL esterase/lipase At4g10955 [Linum perenne]